MIGSHHKFLLALGIVALLGRADALAQDWPQWRGPNRDAKTSDFTPPAEWPAELTKKWTVTVGDGVATPSLVGDKLYVFGRQDGNEVVRCLDAATGNEVWKDEYEADAVRGPASGFAGPRSSPAVADGKVVTLGVQGVLTCYDADTGEQAWRKVDFEGDIPNFATASSPLILDGTCIVQIGSDSDGGIIAYNLTSGDEQWRWTGDGPSYGSPVLMEVDGMQVVIAPTAENLVAIDMNGSLLWEMPYSQGRYNAATPIVNGNTIILAGPNRGISSIKLQKQGGELSSEQGWSAPDPSVIYNTPVIKNGLVFGLSTVNSLFCLRQSGDGAETAWSAPLGADSGGQQEGRRDGGGQQARRGDGGREQGRQGDAGGRRRGRRGRGGGRGGYGSIVDAGSVLFALSPSGDLIAFEPSGEEYCQLAKYKVAESGTYAYPVISQNRVFIKDQDSVTLWTF